MNTKPIPACDVCQHWLFEADGPKMPRPYRTGWCVKHRMRTDAIHECARFEPSASAADDSAREELGLAALAYAAAYQTDPQHSSFRDWSDACDRLEAAAIAWAKTKLNAALTDPAAKSKEAL
jgi:hypothetical protein